MAEVKAQHIEYAEAEQKLQSSFHWFELYLGILVTLLLLAAIAKLACTYRKRKQSRDRWRTKDNLEAGVDGRYLARLLGDVSKLPDDAKCSYKPLTS